jgi:hypothetical protein
MECWRPQHASRLALAPLSRAAHLAARSGTGLGIQAAGLGTSGGEVLTTG